MLIISCHLMKFATNSKSLLYKIRFTKKWKDHKVFSIKKDYNRHRKKISIKKNYQDKFNKEKGFNN